MRIGIRDPKSFWSWIRDQGWKNSGSGSRDKHPGSATLVKVMFHYYFWKWQTKVVDTIQKTCYVFSCLADSATEFGLAFFLTSHCVWWLSVTLAIHHKYKQHPNCQKKAWKTLTIMINKQYLRQYESFVYNFLMYFFVEFGALKALKVNIHLAVSIIYTQAST